ncbi:MAG: hypothetical protein AAGF23_13560 [Acidobacteriota bacterium]
MFFIRLADTTFRAGNTEVATVFDEAAPDDFSTALEYFAAADLEPLTLPAEVKPTKRNERQRPEQPFAVSEIAWERMTGEIQISFLLPPPADSAVELRAKGRWIHCELPKDSASKWFTQAPSLTGFEGKFIEIRVHLETGKTVLCRHWVNDLAELRHAGTGRQIAEAFAALGAPRSGTERQRILAELQQIGLALITAPAEFPDPLVRSHAPRESERVEDEDEVAPIDPKTFIRSLGELANDPAHHLPSLAGISLLGVLRALFEFDTDPAADESDLGKVADDSQEGSNRFGDMEMVSGEEIAEKNSKERGLISDREKEKLRGQMRQFLDSFRAPDFAASCTATQLQQAAAYPLAVALQGLRGGWVESGEVVSWAREVFDILFREQLPYSKNGMIAAVSARYAATGSSSDFRRIVGDGTLWVALLHALISLPWTTPRERFERALAIRWVYRSQDLLATTDAGRMGSLIRAFERRHECLEFDREAPRLAAALDVLEQTLAGSWKALVEDQRRQEILHQCGDLLWHPKPGWAIALSESRASPGSKLDAYLHMRAKESRIVGVGFFVNVSKAAEVDPGLCRELLDVTAMD